MHNLKHSEPDKASAVKKLILIGASTGGPGHIQKIVQSLPTDFSAAVVLAQHIADEYIPSFVNQLKMGYDGDILAVKDQLTIQAGKIYICSFLTQIKLAANRLNFHQEKSRIGRYNPDIDQLFESASLLTSRYQVMGVILTGIGDDGVQGCKQLSENGGTCITESETTAVVYGMPLQAKLKIKNISIQGLDEIIQTIKVFGR